MRAKSFKGMTCSIAGALEAVGDRWGILLMRDLGLGLVRYGDLQRSTGIPPRTLADRLEQLEGSGLLTRVPYQEKPPRHEYRLTPKGREFHIVILALAQWGDRFDASGAGAPPVAFVDRETGRPVRLALVNEANAVVGRERIRTIPGPGADASVRARLER